VLLIWNDLSSIGVFDDFVLDSRSNTSGQRPGQRSSTVDHPDIRKRKANYVLVGAGAIMLAVGDTRWLKVHNESI
jgi:hypothetical protein